MKQLRNPLVSIITPGWNGKEFVHRLLESILIQTYTNIEYIYVDDGSTDGTKDVVLSFKHRFEERGISFKYIYKDNGGLCSAIEEGLKNVSGECLCWPEYDDILLPSAISERVRFLEMHPDCAAVTCDAFIVSNNDLNTPIDVLSYNNKNRFDRNHFVQLLTGNSIFTAACHMVRMDIFDITHPNRKIFQSRVGCIWQMLLPIFYKYNRGFISTPLIKWVIRPDSISNEKYSLEKRISVDEEFLKIRYNVLDSICMPEEDKTFYKSLVELNTADCFMKNALVYKNRDLFYRGYDYYIRNNIRLSSDKYLIKLQVDYKFIYYLMKLCMGLKSLIYSLLRKLYHFLLKNYIHK